VNLLSQISAWSGPVQDGVGPFLRTTDSAEARPVRGFTLIELLAVMAIITVLGGLLLPALAQAKAKVRRLECLSRARQWTMAFRMYVDENDGWIPRECYERLGEVTINNWSQVKGRPRPDGNTDSSDVWYNALPPYLDQRSTSAYAAPPDRKNFYERRNLIHCPAARFPTHAYQPNYQFALFSMAMNSQLIQFTPTIKFALIENKDPVRTVLFLDNLLEGERKVDPAQEDHHLGQPGAWANRFSARHERGGNLTFADGHAEWFPGTRVVETNPRSMLKGGPILPPRDIVWEIHSY
jgi:prepilin-type N-terminal cleavage/methylation domain-containing protein/prepilin-type processing-associated H-X9-DG protein